MISADVPWIGVTPSNGSSSGPADVRNHTLTFNTANLSAGTYSGTVSLTAPGTLNTPKNIPITLSISDGLLVLLDARGFNIGPVATWPNTGLAGGNFVAETDQGKICFAQTKPTKRAPGAIKRNESKLFVTFRPADNINDEVSITSGHDYKASSVSASSGKRKYSFFSQKDFAWLLDDQEEKNFIKLMKRATDLIVKARTTKGAETTDHYSMMGFTKAYNTAKKTCS